MDSLSGHPLEFNIYHPRVFSVINTSLTTSVKKKVSNFSTLVTPGKEGNNFLL